MQPYKSPPLNEVVAEFHLNKEWDLTIPGLVFEQLKDRFPIVRMPASGTITIPAPPQFKGLGPDLVIPNPILRTDRVLFFSHDESQLVQVAPSLLVVNKVKSYTQWEDFLPLVMEVYRKYCLAVPNCRVVRLGLQYVNRIDIPAENGRAEIENYLEFRPLMGPRLPQDHGLFSVNAQYLFNRTSVTVQLGGTDFPEPDVFRSILEFRALGLDEAEMTESGIKSWMENTHDIISTLFEGCITDKTRELFRR